MPGGSLASGKCLTITGGVQKLTGINAPTVKLTFGATTVSLAAAVISNALDVLSAKICNNTSSTAAQWELWTLAQGSSGYINSGFASPAEDTTGSIAISLTVSVASPDTWQGRGWTVLTEP